MLSCGFFEESCHRVRWMQFGVGNKALNQIIGIFASACGQLIGFRLLPEKDCAVFDQVLQVSLNLVFFSVAQAIQSKLNVFQACRNLTKLVD